MRSFSRRALLTSATALCGLGAARAAPALVLNDASRLSPVPVAGHAVVRVGDDNRVIAELRALLQAAARAGQPLCVGGARHSMGGQSLPRDGVAVSLAAPLCGGTFYLPYRLHARPEQVRAAYPQLDAFIAKKHYCDPQLRFRNLMWDKFFV